MNYEEGSEPSVQDGEGFSETGLTEAHGLNQAGRGRDLAAETCSSTAVASVSGG
jgi:allantoinase